MPVNKKKQQVKSKYFTIDSYFKAADSKIITRSTTELCLICSEEIQTDSISMEVHTNLCLDNQEKLEQKKSPSTNMKEQLSLGDFDTKKNCSSLFNRGDEKSLSTFKKDPPLSDDDNVLEKSLSLANDVKKDSVTVDDNIQKDFQSAINIFRNNSLSPSFDSFFNKKKDEPPLRPCMAKQKIEKGNEVSKRVLPMELKDQSVTNSVKEDSPTNVGCYLDSNNFREDSNLFSLCFDDSKKTASHTTKVEDLPSLSYSTVISEGKENTEVYKRTLPSAFMSMGPPKKEPLKSKDANILKSQNKAPEFSLCSITDGSSSHKRKGDTDTPSPTLWKSLFAMRVPNGSSLTKNPSIIDAKPSPTPKKKKTPKVCPFYKYVKDTRFVVDAFSYGEIASCTGYFLSHYHSDHYMGLRSSWSHGPIYCSQVTANLIGQELRVDSKYIHALPMNKLCRIPHSTIQVALIDANHCPGSVLFLFVVKRPDKTVVRHLHTGDFRASPRMCIHPLIRQPDNPSIQSLYLDTTYLSPQYAFPAQEECIKAVCDIAQKETMNSEYITMERAINTSPLSSLVKPKKKLFVVGTYTVGKERVFINIAKKLNVKIYAPQKKLSILKCLEDDELKSMLTEDPREAQVHVISLRDIRADKMAAYLCDFKDCFDSLIAFKPTGWTYQSSKAEQANMTFSSLSDIVTPPSDRSLTLTPYYASKNIKLFGVPYSEHSSFRELASFIASLTIGCVVPTVNTKQADEQLRIINQWQMDKTSKRTEVVPYSDENYW
ncbi:DNA repair metallo-beta-lactamase-domain-containing protein [Sporodiniella umbellata]|nr:DNA repair metallo-beta-lactamase-domain-containing protein [Sporodiniella umbellata]